MGELRVFATCKEALTDAEDRIKTLESAAMLSNKLYYAALERCNTLDTDIDELKAELSQANAYSAKCESRLAFAGLPKPGEEKPPRDIVAESIWEEAGGKLGGDPRLLAMRAVGHDDTHLDVWCPNEVMVSWIKGSYGERLGKILAPRKLKLIHGGGA